jgi:hypothetical protein
VRQCARGRQSAIMHVHPSTIRSQNICLAAATRCYESRERPAHHTATGRQASPCSALQSSAAGSAHGAETSTLHGRHKHRRATTQQKHANDRGLGEHTLPSAIVRQIRCRSNFATDCTKRGGGRRRGLRKSRRRLKCITQTIGALQAN